jgi:hypothetical protein
MGVKSVYTRCAAGRMRCLSSVGSSFLVYIKKNKRAEIPVSEGVARSREAEAPSSTRHPPQLFVIRLVHLLKK